MPLAVEIAAREGARTVWLPTVDSVNESGEADASFAPGAKVAGLDGAAARAARRGRRASSRCRSSTTTARVLPETRDGAARRSPGTGWCSRPATSRATRSSPSSTPRVEEGVGEIVVTHPDFPSQSLSFEDQARARGARARCSSAASRRRTPARSTWEHVYEAIRATGAEHSVLSTDLGQIANPPVEDGLGADGRPAARGGLRRGGGARDGGGEHADGWPESTREPAPARDRRALGRLRVARRRRDRRDDEGRRRRRG